MLRRARADSGRADRVATRRTTVTKVIRGPPLSLDHDPLILGTSRFKTRPTESATARLIIADPDKATI